MQFLRMYQGLPKNTYILFFVQLINRLGDFVIPFLSLYLISKLGLNTKIAGIIVTCAILSQIPGSMAGGTIADYWSRKKTYLISQTFSAICILLCAFIKNKVLIISLLLLSTFFSAAAKPLINTMIYDSMEPSKREVGQSLSYLGINLGVCIGPLIAGFLFNRYLRLFFIGDAFTSLIAVMLVALRLHEMKKVERHSSNKLISNKQFISSIVTQPKLSVFFLIYLIYCFIYAQHSFSLPLTLTNIFNSNGSIYYGYIMSINAITVILTTAFITYYTRKKSSLFNISLAGIFYALGFGLITIAKTFHIFVISTILWTVGEILISTNSEIYVVNQSDESVRARCCAAMLIISSIGRGTGVIAMGRYIDLFGIASVWPFIMVLAFSASVLTRIFSFYIKKNTNSISDHNEG